MAGCTEVHSQKYELSNIRLRFAFESLEKLMRMAPMKDFVFSPFSIHESLMMVYFASSDETEKRLKSMLHLSEEYTKADWISFQAKMISWNNYRKEAIGYYDQNICWIRNDKNFKKISKKDVIKEYDFFGPNKIITIDSSSFNFKQEINEVLKNEMQDCLHQCVNFRSINADIEFILSSVLRFGGHFRQAISSNDPKLNYPRRPKTVISSKLSMFVTELPFEDKATALYILFPAEKLPIESNAWKMNDNISGLIERLSSKDGTLEFRNIINDHMHPTSREKVLEESIIRPNVFELEEELPIIDLLLNLNILQLLEPDEAKLNDFTRENLTLGSYMHRAYIKVTEDNVIAGAMNMFLTKNETTIFEALNKLADDTQKTSSFIWLIYDRHDYCILSIGVINQNPQLELENILLHTASSV